MSKIFIQLLRTILINKEVRTNHIQIGEKKDVKDVSADTRRRQVSRRFG